MVKRKPEGQGSFNFDEEPIEAPPLVKRRDWQEVPQARFLSWSRKMQIQYCIRRDEQSLKDEELAPHWPFFRERIRMYQEEL